jgi:sugar/nucleoside kinase (ribokinase family)
VGTLHIPKLRSEHREIEHVDVAVIGDFAKDRVVYRGQVEISSGGSVYYGAIALQRIGIRTVVITRLAEQDFQLLDELKREGITVYAQPAPQTSGIENIYTTENMDHRVCHTIGFAGPFRLGEMPRISAHTYLVGPLMAGIVDIPILRDLSTMGNVALDAQGFVRVRKGNDLVITDWSEKEMGLAFVKVLKVDDVESEVLTGEKNRFKALKSLATYGPSEIVLTHANGVTVYAGGEFYEAPFVPRKIVGRTGRGDTCLAVYLGTRLNSHPKEACWLAAAATSLKLERAGPFAASFQDVQKLAALLSSSNSQP